MTNGTGTRCLLRKSDARRTSCPRTRASSSHAPCLLDARFRGNDARPQALAVYLGNGHLAWQLTPHLKKLQYVSGAHIIYDGQTASVHCVRKQKDLMMPEPTECQRTQAILLTVDNVTKRFGGVVAVDGCSLGIRRGTITGLIGPNGAGKTTLFNMIAGLYPPDAGRIWFEGERIDGLPPHRIFARKIARTFQIARALKRMTVLENLLLVPAQQRGENFFTAWFQPRQVSAQEQSLRERAEEILQRVKLHSWRHEYAGNLSGGQKKLLELARTMMSDATFILLDEPGAGVNPTLMQELVGHIQHLQSLGRTFLLIEHDMDLVMDICNPVIVMSQGRTLMEGTPRQVRNDPRVMAAYLGV